jgi:hypothetical protein
VENTRAQTREFREILTLQGVNFGYTLCCRPQDLPPLSGVAHVWMNTRTLYGQRKRAAVNLGPMTNYFWRRCGLAGTHIHPQTQESFLLASLCPVVRSSAAQRIFTDARLGRGKSRSGLKQFEASELERLLAAQVRSPRARDHELTPQEFYAQTQGILEMPKLRREEEAAYTELSEELFSEARPVLVERGTIAADLVLKKWGELTRRIGRRSGPAVALKKTAMNILSYEARAAVHRCYSCVWNDLLVHLGQKYKLSAESTRFLKLMHLEQVSESNLAGANFHLFHGHVFALHPGMAILMRTHTGKSLLGRYVAAENEQTRTGAFQRLLAAISTSLCYYTGRRHDTRRTKRGIDPGEEGLDAIVEQQIARRSGKRRRRNSTDD